VRACHKGCEGSLGDRDSKAALVRGRTQEAKRPKGARAPTWTKHLGANRGTASDVGVSRWSAGNRLRSLLEKRQSGRGVGNNSFDHDVGGKLRREKPRSVGS
jgi:hypothetical protein